MKQFINRKVLKSGRVGVFSTGHYIYWPQFPGLKEKLINHSNYFVGQLKKNAWATIIAFEGICDSSQRAFEAGNFFACKQLDLLICFVGTYTPSANVFPVIQRAGVPVVLVCLQPSECMDYAKATTALQLENDNITSLPEISCAMVRANQKPLDCIVGALYEDERAWKRVFEWCEIATVLHELENARLGLMGHTYEGMLDMNSDPTMFDAHFGMHIEHIEMDDLKECIDAVTEKEITEKLETIQNIFDFPERGAELIATKVKNEDLLWPAKVACGMDRLAIDFNLTGLSYYYRGLDNNEFERIHAAMIIGNSFLTTRGIPISGEFDLKNCVAMLIMDRFKAGGSFCEFHPIDFREDFVLVGHDGPHHLAIADGKPALRALSLYHGKRGSGPSVEYKLKVGPITMLGLTQTFDGRFKMVVAEGESLPGPIPASGNTNTRGKFKPDVRTFLERWTMEGPTHHFALGVGHIAKKIKLLARYLNIECVLVTSED
ncbi:L-fucose/L-arabinose isomerase family protein [bacterium]|nr:L-fucose/L-arabinose isomerase family protein [bacterium]